MLRRAILNLASAPDAQAAYLDDLLAPVTGGGSAAAYGNDELALQFEDYFVAAQHMLEAGEISHAEIAAATPLNDILERWSGESNANFWTREALFEDPRWGEVRECARKALVHFPDEVLKVDRGRSSNDRFPPKLAIRSLVAAFDPLRTLAAPIR